MYINVCTLVLCIIFYCAAFFIFFLFLCELYVYIYTSNSSYFSPAELKKVRSAAGGSGGGVHRELARTHQYTLQLERQLRYYLAKSAGVCVWVGV